MASTAKKPRVTLTAQKPTKKPPTTPAPMSAGWRKRLRGFTKWFLIPAAIYFAFFAITNFHHLGQFSHQFYLDNGDGFQNVWNIWWVHHAIIDLHQNPWFTHYLHAPEGISLVPQTMNIYNCFVGIGLIALGFNLVAAVNFAVIFAFVMSGVTMFWLASRLSKSYVAGLLAGFMFTFSSYHFAHGVGHLQLVTMEWVPLFLLAWWELIHRPRYRYGVLAALALLLVILSDYYYFFYSVFAAAILLVYFLWRRELRITKQNIRVFTVFAILVASTCGVLVFSLLQLNKHDPLQGAHDAFQFSLDILAPFVPGGSWYWHSLTEGFWGKLPYFAEASVYFGVGLITLILVALFGHRRLQLPKWTLPWWIIFFTFAVLSLGPRLHINGDIVDHAPLPYAALEDVVTTLRISGMPMRMIFMTLLAGIVLSSLVVAKINLKTNLGKVLLGLLVAVTVIDLYPRPLPLTPTTTLPYVQVLKSLPAATVIDNGAASGSVALLDQTVDEKPMAFGYVTRSTRSVDDKDFHIFADLEQGRYANLCQVYHIRYLATRKTYDMPYPIIYTEAEPRVYIYDLKNSDHC